MKVCYINPTFLVRRPIAELIGRLSKDNDVAVFVPKRLFKKFEGKWHSDSALSKARIFSYSAVNLPFSNFEWPVPVSPMFFVNLFRVFWKYDVIHLWTFFYINSFFTLFFRLFFRKTKLILACDTFPSFSFSSGKFVDALFKVYSRLFGWFLFSVPDKVQVYGKSMIEFALKAGVKRDKIVVLPTGVNVDKFRNAVPIPRTSLGLSDDDFVLFFAGLIVPRKGIDVMLKTVKVLCEKFDNVKLLLVGEGPAKKKFEKMAVSLGIEDYVVFSSWRKDIPSILKSVDVLFLPSRGEGLPGVVMEALASGLPVVASNIPCIPDLISDSVNGFLCEMDDVACFSEKIGLLIKDENLRTSFGKKAVELIKGFDWAGVVSDYVRLYEAVL